MKKYTYYITLIGLTLVVIGIHQSTLHGFEKSYWIFMFAASILLYSVLLNKDNQPQKGSPNIGNEKKLQKKKPKKR